MVESSGIRGQVVAKKFCLDREFWPINPTTATEPLGDTDMSNAEKTSENVLKEMLEAAERSIWELLDQQIGAADMKRLEKLLAESAQVRRRYQECAQIHADLYSHYGANREEQVQSPVLGSLGSLSSVVGSNSPMSD